MIPGTYDLCLYRGDTSRWQFRLWQDEARTMPVDLIGASVLAQIRSGPGGAVQATPGTTIIPPNLIDMVLDATASAALGGGGVWDLQVTYASGDVATPLRGRVQVQQDITRAA